MTVEQEGWELLIIQTESQRSWKVLQEKLAKSSFSVHTRTVAQSFNIYGIQNLDNKASSSLKKWLRDMPEVISVMPNQKFEPRFTPNDELYSEQWALPVIGADQTWFNAKGDTTALGDEIVIAVLDDGILINHPDLIDRVFVNEDEIPGNGIDDDNNGFVDDYHGWNFDTQSDEHDTGWHGTPVSGIVGATTDNELGIAGTAYRTTILPLSIPSFQIVRIISAMEYAFLERRKYNHSDGREGAFIVAVNLSLGVDKVFPDSLMGWCNIHDSLGSVGIISVVSATNSSVMVDTFGDIPTLCPSDYLISVTRTDKNDKLSTDESGYSSKFVDIGAPGDDILTTSNSGTYRLFDGTSAAAPFVSGAVATLYSIPCRDFAEQARQQPAQTALAIKDLILNTVDFLPTLKGKTVSEGRLNVYKAMVASTSLCDIETAPFSLQTIYPNPSTGVFNFRYTVSTFEDITVDLYDMKGRHVFQRTVSPQVFEEREFTFDIGTTIADGMYIISVKQGEEAKWGKLLLQKHD